MNPSHRTRARGSCGLGLLALFGCTSTPTEPSALPTVPDSSMAALAEPEPPSVYAPMDTGGMIETIFDYLLERYDVDGDERITREEYVREGGHFERLDKDEDGVITAKDYDRRAARAKQQRDRQAQASLARYFQDDDDYDVLQRDELLVALAAYDTSQDGRVDAEEFGCAAEPRTVAAPEMSARMERELKDVDPWEALLAGADTDTDGALARSEISAWYDQLDADADGAWSPGARNRRRGSRESRGGAGMSGPAEGTLAPDFTLAAPEGGRPVTLSDFRGELPVALIFGSYT